MKEMYSSADDCLELAKLLKSKLKEKIEFYGSAYLEVVQGKYHSLPYSRYESFIDYRNDEVEFSYRFLENGFLSIQVNDSAYKKFTLGHKLAVLSDLYEAISSKYGEPTIFYTIKDDDENSINLEWAFLQKEETIAAFKNGCRFDDAEVDELIIMGEERIGAYKLNKGTKELVSKSIGLPFEMLLLINENVDDFVLYKKGGLIGYGEYFDSIITIEDEKTKVKK